MITKTPGFVDENDGRGLALAAVTRDQSRASRRIALEETAETEARVVHGATATSRSAETRETTAIPLRCN